MLLGMSENLLITADWILPISGAPLEGGAVDVRDGRIHAVGSAAELLPGAEESRRMDLGRAALLPGLVNTHAHLELTALRGFLEEDDFFSWIRKLTETKYGRLNEDDLLCSARLGVIEATRAGITTIADIADAGVSLEALVEGGLRSILYQEVFGPDPDQAEESLRGLQEKLESHEAARAQRVTIGISPHAPYTVSRRLFEMLAEFAPAGGYPVSVHAAESAAEGAFVRKAEGPFADYLRSRNIEVKPLGDSTIRFLEQTGLLRLEYKDLAEICAEESVWASAHQPLKEARPGLRQELCQIVLDELRRALAIDPNAAAVHYNLGVVHAKSERWEKARSAFNQAIALDAKHAGARDGLNYKSYSEAIKLILTARSINSIDINIIITFFLFKKIPSTPRVNKIAPRNKKCSSDTLNINTFSYFYFFLFN